MTTTQQSQSMRVRPSDLRNAVHIINPDKKVIAFDSEVNEDDFVLVLTIRDHMDVWADLDGYECEQGEGFPALLDSHDTIASERKEACAKIVKSGPHRIFFVKRNSHGQFLNPFGMYEERRHMKMIKGGSQKMYEYSRVNPKAFNLYINFLKTKNEAWLRQAQREEV